LPKNTKLSSLQLHHCNITDAGCEALTKALRDNLSVREINLSNNRLTDASASSLARLVHFEISWVVFRQSVFV
jgi:hypothetical protein